MPTPPLKTILGQPSWPLRASHVSGWLTRLGGHVGPVVFRLGRRTVRPFSVAPWAGESLDPGTPALLRSLRGDFFCLPFGGNGTPWRGERHPPHGETANAAWSLAGLDRADGQTTLRATLRLKVRAGAVEKILRVVDGETALYSRHVIRGLRGPMSVGHHAMLKFPDAPGSGVISTSRLQRAQVMPTDFETPANRGYSSLKTGATFRSLQRVPLREGGFADVSRYPARRGFEDLVMLTADPREAFAWTAVVFPAEGYVWFSLRDPRQLRHTVLWISNGGRHYPPWNGRHTGVMGLEDVTAYFAYGQAESAGANPLNRQGIPTALKFDPRRPTTVSTIMGVAAIPRGFDRVATVRPVSGGIELAAASGRTVQAPLDLGWLTPAPAA